MFFWQELFYFSFQFQLWLFFINYKHGALKERIINKKDDELHEHRPNVLIANFILSTCYLQNYRIDTVLLLQFDMLPWCIHILKKLIPA